MTGCNVIELGMVTTPILYFSGNTIKFYTMLLVWSIK
jgi:phosphomannomutase